GIAAYSLLREHRVGPGSKVGGLGPGGAGHLAVRLAEAMGAKASVLAVGSAARDPAPGPGAADGSPEVLIDIGTAVSGRPGDAGSLVGSIAETRQLLEFCAGHQVACEIELVDARDANEAWERILAADVQHGFVLDLATLGGND
ncbi:NAD(P)-dependent alcohol dehydrogenase, partial [Paeniglutamicibacter sp. MACA_103]